MTLLPGIHKENYLLLLSTLVLFLSIFVGVSLVQQQQEIRERAQTQISCLERSGPVVTKSGFQKVRYYTGGSPLAKNTKIDARNASWIAQWPVQDRFTHPVELDGGPNVCFAGGLIQGNYPDKIGSDSHSTWDYTHGTFAVRVRIPNFTLEGTRIHNFGDGLTITSSKAGFFTVRGVHFSYIRDDCIENDFLYSGLIDDSLFDGCYMGFSTRSECSNCDGSNEIMTIQNSLVRLQAMDGVYQNKKPIPGHFGFFKWDTGSSSTSTKLILKNNVFRADQQPSGTGLGLPKGKVIECSNNIMVWLGPGSNPPVGSGQDPLTTSIGGKPCFTITKDRSVWDNAKSDWLKRHGDSPPPPPSTPTPTKFPTPSPVFPGDLDKDGDVDIFDYNALVENFGNTNCGNVADINSDCKVDIFDYNILIENFGEKG